MAEHRRRLTRGANHAKPAGHDAVFVMVEAGSCVQPDKCPGVAGAGWPGASRQWLAPHAAARGTQAALPQAHGPKSECAACVGGAGLRGGLLSRTPPDSPGWAAEQAPEYSPEYSEPPAPQRGVLTQPGRGTIPRHVPPPSPSLLAGPSHGRCSRRPAAGLCLALALCLVNVALLRPHGWAVAAA